jgi:hypothetical protein
MLTPVRAYDYDLDQGDRARPRYLVCGSVAIYRAHVFDQIVFRHYVNLRHLAPPSTADAKYVP